MNSFCTQIPRPQKSLIPFREDQIHLKAKQVKPFCCDIICTFCSKPSAKAFCHSLHLSEFVNMEHADKTILYVYKSFLHFFYTLIHLFHTFFTKYVYVNVQHLYNYLNWYGFILSAIFFAVKRPYILLCLTVRLSVRPSVRLSYFCTEKD